MFIETYEVLDGIVYRVRTFPNDSVIKTAIGNEYQYRIYDDIVVFQKFENTEFVELETTQVPMIGEEIDYDAINSRIEYWRSQGSAT